MNSYFNPNYFHINDTENDKDTVKFTILLE
jgi:hypothetical protein